MQCHSRQSPHYTLQTQKAHTNYTPSTHIPLPLCLQWIIVRKLQQALQDAAVMPNYHQYLIEKHNWMNQDCDNINWNVLPLAMNQFTTNDCQQLQKFLHDWLPLNSRHHTSKSATTTLCLSCHKQDEDFWHFLECQHQPCPTLFCNLQQNLTKLHLQHNIDPDLYQMLWQGICSICFNTPPSQTASNLPRGIVSPVSWKKDHRVGPIILRLHCHVLGPTHQLHQQWKHQWHNLLLPGNDLHLAIHPSNLDPLQPKPSFQNAKKHWPQ